MARKSKRGGASAPVACKKQLGTCMNEIVKTKGGNLKKAGPFCMAEFNACRVGGKPKSKRAKRVRRAKRAKR